GVEAGGDVALEDADPQPALEGGQRPFQQRRLSRPGRRHEVDGPDPGGPQVAPVLVGDPVVLRKDVLQHHDAGSAGVGVAAVVPDVVVVVVVVLVFRAVAVAVEAAHQTSASSSDTTANSSPEISVTSRL